MLAQNVLWSPPNFIGCPSCLETMVTPVTDQMYVIEAFTVGGCSDKDSVTIRVDNTPVIYLPNIFSPNGDQVNDHFTITTNPLTITSLDEILIFDRWGGIMAQHTNFILSPVYELWDGNTSRGQAPPGIYVYLLTYTLADGSRHTNSGDIMLMR
jgi:gliding motility-associated-like protein